MKKTLLDDVEKIYFSIPCISSCECIDCKNGELCKSIIRLLKSLKKHYICNKNINLCSKCNKKEDCEIIQKIY